MVLPRITVVTPNLNQDRFLERAICSVLDQGYENLEYFVVDGGSIDESVDILRLYDGDLTAWTSQPDDGPAEGINKGLRQATGDIVAFLASDDLYLPGTLHQIAEAFMQHKAKWVVGPCVRIDAEDQPLATEEPRPPQSLAAYLMHDDGVLPSASTFMRRDFLDWYGYLDERYQYAFDYEYWCRLIVAGQKPMLLDEPLGAKREHDANMTPAVTMIRGREYIEAARQYAEHLDPEQRSDLWKNCDERERIYALAQAEACGPKARRYLLNQMIKHPWWLGDDALRHVLFHGVEHPLRADELRPAA